MVNEDKDFMLVEAMAVGLGKMIENQEKRGQQSVICKGLVPKKYNESMKTAIEFYKDWGFKNIKEDDDLFYSVELPEGWKLESTGHSMWNNIKDNKGRIRAVFFYKAAFYDRDAFLSPETRFHVIQEDNQYLSYEPLVKNPKYEKMEYEEYRYKIDNWHIVKDGDKEVFRTKIYHNSKDLFSNTNEKKSLKEANQWLITQGFPEWKDPMKYWD